MKGKHIVLGISGGIAAYKSVTLLRLLIKAGAEVQVVITPNGKEFITPATLSALSGKPVVWEFFAANTGEWHSHVDLGIWADLMIIAPATASTIGKMANGIADNMLITTYLSAKEPVMVAPAMDLDMFCHPTTRRNLRQLEADGVKILEAGDGELASGLVGKGRMMEPEEIFAHVEEFFKNAKTEDFKRKKILITAGPTFEKIDPVRFVGNRSSGKMGFALANEFASRGAEVTVVAGPVSPLLDLHPGVKRINVEEAREMYEGVEENYTDTDIAVFAAAVADYRPEQVASSKIKREAEAEMQIKFVSNPDIALEMGKRKKPGQINVGFALETDNGAENARKKLEKKNFDLIVLNRAGKEGEGFNSDTNTVTIFGSDGMQKEFANKLKSECAADIADAVRKLISDKI